MLIGIIGAVFLFFTYIKDKDFNSLKYIVLIGPFVMGGIIYGSIFLLTKDMPPDVCDGGALMGMLLAFMFIGLGILMNVGNIVYLIIKNLQEKNNDI